MENKAVQFCKIIRKGNDWNALHENIYDSILIPVIKCLEYYKKIDKPSLNSEWKNYIIYFPLVVLNSEIFFINSHLLPRVVDKVDYISFTRDIHSKNIKGNYLIDFVSKDGLEKYIQYNIDRFVDNFIAIVTE